MGKWLLIVLVFIFAVCCCTAPPKAPNDMKWESFDDGLFASVFEKAKEEDKLVYIYAHSNSCDVCVRMDKDTYSNPKIAAVLDEKYIFVVLEGDENYDIIKKLNIEIYPTALIYLPNGKLIIAIVEYMGPNKLYDIITIIPKPTSF